MEVRYRATVSGRKLTFSNHNANTPRVVVSFIEWNMRLDGRERRDHSRITSISIGAKAIKWTFESFNRSVNRTTSSMSWGDSYVWHAIPPF